MSDLRIPLVHRFAFALVAALWGAAGCAEDDGGAHGAPSDGAVGDVAAGLPDAGDATSIPDIDPGEISTGEPDKPRGNGIVIDEAGMRATVDGGDLVLRVPVSSIDGGVAKGTLRAAVRLVDGSETASTAEAPYDVTGTAEDAVLHLAMPTVQTQADLARWVVRVEDVRTAPDVGAHVTRSLLHVLPAWELTLEGPKTVLAGRSGSWRVRTADPVAHAPLADVPVRLVVVGADGTPIQVDAATALTGDAIFPLDLPSEGTWDVTATGWSQGTEAQVGGQVDVEPSPRKILLTTDKPIYQPGQVVHLRALALQKPALAPVAGEAVVFEVEDGKGNKVLKKEVTADGWGIAATTFQIGHIVNQGTYTLRALLGDLKAEKTVQVGSYALPKFKLGVSLAAPWYMPGMTIEGVVDAAYFFGKPVAGGTVDIAAAALDVGEDAFARVTGKTDDEGRMSFQVKLPPVLVGLPLEQGMALVQFGVTVTDTAGQVVEKTVAVLVSAERARLLVVPEGGVLVPGTENQVHVFASDPLGAPIEGATVALSSVLTQAPLTVTTDAFGYAGVLLEVPADAGDGPWVFSAVATLPGGQSAKASVSFDVQGGTDHLLVRTEKAIYSVGETVTVQIFTTAQSPHVYLDWLNQGQVVAMQTLEASGGVATMTVDLDVSLRGDNSVEAYIVDGNGQIVRATRTLFVKDVRDLKITLSTDKPQYAPGEEATLTFSVQTEDGAPASAALGVQIVDEAVFALVDAQPGLLKTYFALDDALAEPQYEIHGATWDLTDVIFGEAGAGGAEGDAAQKKAEASFAAMPMAAVTGLHASSWLDLPGDVKGALSPFWVAERADLVTLYKAAAKTAVAVLEAKGCPASDSWCYALDQSYLTLLVAEIGVQVQVWDFWGNAYLLTPGDWDMVMSARSIGPDEQEGTDDDWWTSFDVQDLDLPDEYWRSRGGGGGGWGGADAASASDTGGGGPPGGNGDDEEGPRVRSYFPETLYVNPALIAGGDGKAEVTLAMADSITEWRVSSMAHSMDGRLGSGVAGVTVFQDFFVDIDFPATLTRGDEVTFPIAIYNYLDEPQDVSVSLEPASWYTALGQTQVDLTVGPQQVVSAQFPVRVDTVGLHGLTVTGLGTKLSDAVHRTVKVVPDGKEVTVIHAGALGAGSVEHDVLFPAEAVPGSESLYVNVYPAYLSQVVEGLDSMLTVPYG